MLYPATMQQHGPARTVEQYLDHLYDQLANDPAAMPGTARSHDLMVRIAALEDEIGARSGL